MGYLKEPLHSISRLKTLSTLPKVIYHFLLEVEVKTLFKGTVNG